MPDITIHDFLELSFPSSLLAEVSELLGPDKTVELLSVFGGIPLNLPSKEDLRVAMRDYSIYLSTKRGVASKTLGQQHGISRQRVSQIFKETEARVEAYKQLKASGQLRVPVFTKSTLDDLTKLKEILDDGIDS